ARVLRETPTLEVVRHDHGQPDRRRRCEHVGKHREDDHPMTLRAEPGQPLLPCQPAERHDDSRHLSRLSGVKRLTNAEIGEQLDLFAALLDLSGSSFYTSRAYRRAAETIRETKASIDELVAAGRVEELRGIRSEERRGRRGWRCRE